MLAKFLKRVPSLALGLAAVLGVGVAQAENLGDFAPATNICGKFTTFQPSTGAPFTLGGTPALSVYKDASTTQSTTGVTLTASFDSVTGLNHYCVDTSADGTFYSAGSNFNVVITTGTVDSVSVVGSVVGTFTLNKVAALRPATAGRTVNIGSSGEIGAVGTGAITEASFATTTGSFDVFGISRQGTAQAATSTTITLDASAPFASDTNLGSTIWVRGSSAGNYWQSGVITDFDGTTKVATVTFPAGFVTPTGTILFKTFGTAPSTGSGGSLTAADVWTYGGGRTLSAATNITSTGGTITVSSGAVTVGTNNDKTGYGLATDAVNSTSLAASAVTELQTGLATSSSISSLASTLSTMDGKLDTIDSLNDAIKAKTDQLTFGVTNTLNVNMEYQNGVQVCGDGSAGDKWRACP